MTRENALQKRCLLWARQKHSGEILVVNTHGDGYTNKGFPDLIVFGRRMAIAVELKSEDTGYQLQPDQQVWRNRFYEIGMPHYICKSLEEFKAIVKKEFEL